MILDLNELGTATSYEGEITFLGETAGFRNTLGMYRIAPDGTIQDVQILFANASQQGGGGNLVPGESSVALSFSAADKFGFFILPDSNSQGSASLLTKSKGYLEFRTPTGDVANVNDTTSPMLFYVDEKGKATAIQSLYNNTSFHSAASPDNNYALNGDFFNHVRFTFVIENGEAVLKMAFEDLWSGGDKNFNDVVFRLDLGVVNTLALAPEVAPLIPTILGTSDDEVNVAAKGVNTVNLLANDASASDAGVHITHLNGVAVVEGQTITLATGEKLTLGPQGVVTVQATATSGDVKVTYLTADAKDGIGVGSLTIHTAPVEGTEAADQMHVGYTDAKGHVIDGADGASDVIMAYGGNDKVTAGAGDDNIYGGSGDDFMRAGEGDDLLDGGEGNDVLDGQSGADAMSGGMGADVYYIDDAKDTVADVANGGYDKVISTLSHVLGGDFEELWLAEGSVALDGTGNGLDNKIVGNANANQILGLEGVDNLFGQAGDDRLEGGAGGDLLYGGTGSDLISGGDGADKLYGGTGLDTLLGGAGNDVLSADGGATVRLIGGTGSDLLSGGAGVDVFVFAKGDGADTVKNFQDGQDVLVFSGMSYDTLTIRAIGSVVQITNGLGDSVTLSATSLSQIDQSDFLFA